MRIVASILASALAITASAGVPDSVFVMATAPQNGSGMYLQWSADGTFWQSVTSQRVLGSDYGPWGSHKKLFAPTVAQGADGQYAVVFQVSDRDAQFAVTQTSDFVHWRPQDYPYMEGVGQCLAPVVRYVDGGYEVTFHNRDGRYFLTRSADLIHFSQPVAVERAAMAQKVRVAHTTLDALRNYQTALASREVLHNELARDNAQRFAGLKDVKAEVCVEGSQAKAISDMLMGIFFEDINYAADGGLNAQLIQNGDFEYQPSDRRGDRNWIQTYAWTLKGDGRLITDVEGVSKMNCHAVAIEVAKREAASLENAGWDGIPLRAGERYNLSLYLKGGKVRIDLVEVGQTLATAQIRGKGKDWTRVSATLRPRLASKKATLLITPLEAGQTAIDMVSLVPQDTYKGHGLRRDLAEALEDLHPRFMRFPGGCVTHGDGIGNIYNWKETIGPLEDRKPLRNIWGYHQSRQLGFYEFFQMCEDMGMEPLPVLAAGVPCQNSADGGNGQQGGIPIEQMPQYIQDILDLVEWANGDASTEWGRKRIEQGHKQPFNLKYLGIGNEDLISPTFAERYLMICKAVKEKYPEIMICGTAGPFYYGSDYEEGWRLASENRDVISLVDEHYYLPPSWYIYNQDFYDQYDRSAPHVYLGEWAAHVPGRQSTIETALCEAIHYCSLERNGDVVEMASYAPLLAREGHIQWNPDMIYFDATEVKPTVGYWGQWMCGRSAGDRYLKSAIISNSNMNCVNERLAVSTVRNSRSGKTYLKLVNVLPVEVEAHLQLKDILSGERKCKRTMLRGAFDSTTARPAESEVTLSSDCRYVMPAYSFTVIEL